MNLYCVSLCLLVYESTSLYLTVLIPAEPDKIYDKRRGLTFQQAVDRYDRRFKAADKNGDKKLDREEFADMLHPGEQSCH